MSVKIMTAVFESRTLGPTERLVMLALADHADDDGHCYPSIQRLCERTGLSERAVQTNVRKLCDDGYVTIAQGGGRGRANLYIVRANPARETQYEKPRTENTVSDAVNPAADAGNPAADAPQPSLTIIEPSKQKKGARRKPELPLPENWTPSDRNISDAVQRNFSQQEIEDEADRFRNHHRSKDSRFRDWDAAWRTWLGNARRFAAGGMARGPSTKGRGPGSSLASIAARRQLGGLV